MELPFYTSLFRVERKVYAIDNFALPRPVGLAQLGVGLVAAIVTLSVGGAIGVSPLDPFVGALYFVVPVGAAWFVGRDIREGRGLAAWMATGWRWATEPAQLHGLAPDHGPDRVRLQVTAWAPALDHDEQAEP